MDKRTKSNKVKFSQRKSIVEHPFGTLKRTMNFYYLLTRGLEKVRGEVSVAFLAYNLKRVISIVGIKKLLDLLKVKKPLKTAIKIAVFSIVNFRIKKTRICAIG